MIEIGNESQDHIPTEIQKDMGINDSDIKDFVDAGAEISGNEAEALKKGESLHSD